MACGCGCLRRWICGRDVGRPGKEVGCKTWREEGEGDMRHGGNKNLSKSKQCNEKRGCGYCDPHPSFCDEARSDPDLFAWGGDAEGMPGGWGMSKILWQRVRRRQTLPSFRDGE